MSESCDDEVKFYAPTDTFGGTKPVPSCLPGEDRVPPEFTEPTPDISTGEPPRRPGPVIILNRTVVTACTELAAVETPSINTVYDFVDKHVRDEQGHIIVPANKAFGKVMTVQEGFYRDKIYLTDLTSEVSDSVLTYIADNKIEDVISFRLTTVSIMDSGELTVDELVQLSKLSLEAATELLVKVNAIKDRITEEAKLINLNSIVCEWSNIYQKVVCPEPEGGDSYIGNKYYAGTVIPGDKEYNPHAGLSEYRLYSGIPQSSWQNMQNWLESLDIHEEGETDIVKLVRDRLPQHVRNGTIPYREIVRLSDPIETNRQFGITGQYALFAKAADLPPALWYADQEQIKTVTISYIVPANVVKSNVSQLDADAQARMLAESMLKCMYGNEPVTVECQDLPEYQGTVIEKVPVDRLPVMEGLTPRVGTYTIGKDVILSSTSTSIATAEATSMALGMLVCYYINQEVFLACYIAPEGEEPYDDNKKAQIRRRARGAGVVPTSDNWVKADPATGTLGQEVYIPAGFFTSTVSPEEADELARTLAQSLLECCYVNERIEVECPECVVTEADGTPVPVKPVRDATKNWRVVIEEGKFTSCESQEAANELAMAEALSMLECYYGNPEILPTCVPDWVLDSIAAGKLQLPLSQAIVGRGMALAYLDDGEHKVLIEDLPETAMDGVRENTYITKDDCQSAYDQAIRSRKTLRDAIKNEDTDEVCLYMNDEFLYGCLVYDIYNEFGLRVQALHLPDDLIQNFYKYLDEVGREIKDVQNPLLTFMGCIGTYDDINCIPEVTAGGECCNDGCHYLSKRTCSRALTGEDLSDDNLNGMWTGYAGGCGIIGFTRVVVLYDKDENGNFVELARTGYGYADADVVDDPENSDARYTNTRYAGPPPTEVGAEPMERWVFTDKITKEVKILYKRTLYFVKGLDEVHLDPDKPKNKWLSKFRRHNVITVPEGYYEEYMNKDKYDMYVTDMDGIRLTLINPCGSPYVYPCLWPGYKKGYKSSGEAYYITTKFHNETTQGCYECIPCNEAGKPCSTLTKSERSKTFGGHDYQSCATRYRPITAVIAQYPSSISADTIVMTAKDIAAWEGVEAAEVTLEDARAKVNEVARAQVDAIMAQLECNKKKKEIHAACDWDKQTFCCCPMSPSDHPSYKVEQVMWKNKVYSVDESPIENFGLPNPVWYTGLGLKDDPEALKLSNRCCKVTGPPGDHAGNFTDLGNILEMGVSADCYTCDVFKETEKIVLAQLQCEFGNPEVTCTCTPVPVCHCEGKRWERKDIILAPCERKIEPNTVWARSSVGAAAKALQQGLDMTKQAGCPDCPDDATDNEYCCGTEEIAPEINDEYTAKCEASVSPDAELYKKLPEGVDWGSMTLEQKAEYDERSLCIKAGQGVQIVTASAEYTVQAGMFSHCLKSVADARAKAFAEQMVATMCNPEVKMVKSDPQEMECCKETPPDTPVVIGTNWQGQRCIGPEKLELAAGAAEGLCKESANTKARVMLSSMSGFCIKLYFSHAATGDCDKYDLDVSVVGDIQFSVVASTDDVSIPSGMFVSFDSQEDADARAQNFADSLCFSMAMAGGLFCNDEQCADCDGSETEKRVEEWVDEQGLKHERWVSGKKRMCIPRCAVTASTKEQANSVAQVMAEGIADVACRQKSPDVPTPTPTPIPIPIPGPTPQPGGGDCYCCKDTYVFDSDLFTMTGTKKQNANGEKGDCVEYHVTPNMEKIKEIIEENIGDITFEFNPSYTIGTTEYGELKYESDTIRGTLGDPNIRNDANVTY